MRKIAAMLAVGFILSMGTMPALAGIGNANFVLGGRTASDDIWEDLELESQGAFGVTVDFGKESWPITIAVGLHGGAAEEDVHIQIFTATIDETLRLTTSELSVGVHKVWKTGGATRPFLGGGVSSVSTELEFGDLDDDDTSPGLYVQGGVFWRIGSRFNLGLDFRGLFGTDLEIGEIDVDSDYLQAGLLLGWGWPAE